ncbi:ATP-binding cassette domain-containing protein [Streptomyces sp. NPDC008137]|uniref:ABC transporter ATP-binding protein n=1 Tax=Streptomyces sp. NPDC008137 TaxID=3364813 RepID=UPI0036F0A3A6
MTAHGYDLAVDVRGLRERYGDVTAVDGVYLGIRRGEVFGLLGPNGAGKSTMVEILQGNRDRDAGEVSVLGSDAATATRAWRSRVGIVRQDESAPAELTVREIVRHFARYYPRPRDPEEVIGLAGLEAKADSRIKTLSGGQRRRLDVALGVIGGPDLLLLDEPTTGFDPAARRQFWSLVRALADDGTMILLTTHYRARDCAGCSCRSRRRCWIRRGAGARTRGSGARRVVRRRIGAVPADVPLEGPARGMSDADAGGTYTWERSFRLRDTYFALIPSYGRGCG